MEPAITSDIATNEARNGLNPKNSIKFLGGSGNFEIPCIINATPNAKRNEKFEIYTKFLVIFSRKLSSDFNIKEPELKFNLIIY